jgi:UDPglucose 6-dehydrogenase
MARAGELGAEEALAFLREVDQINLRQRTHTVNLARAALDGSFAGKNVTVLGAAFKPDSDDVRDSPALAVAAAIFNAGGNVVVHDPKALANAARVYPTLTYVEDLAEALADAELVLHLTEWPEYREFDPTTLGSSPRQRHLIDARNRLDPIVWRAAGWTYRALGRPTA